MNVNATSNPFGFLGTILKLILSRFFPNWRGVLIVYNNSGVFLFNESHFTAAVEDLDASMKTTRWETVEANHLKMSITCRHNA